MNPMKLHVLLLTALLLPLPAACITPAPDVPCRCGTPMGDLEGCVHPLCREGPSNPDNPDCVCGTLEIPGEEKK